ncbi:MAG: hypothetical protein IPI67_11425 [Myxococcales bacterium]|nr:hypothetical protein [Myxococcales bacterium]
MTTPSDNGSSPGGGAVGRTTLRPPEWTSAQEGPRSAASLTFEIQLADSPVSRRTGPRAELAHLAARIESCAAAGDTEGERAAATSLARALVMRGTELDTATKLARRALLLGHDAALREELSGWFAALGEPGLAAATLRPLVADLSGQPAARILTRIGVLLGRAGDAAGAADALFDAAREDPADAAAPELQAGIGAWQPEAVPAERAAEGYLEGFRRREAAGDRAGAFEDLLRAFEMAPGEPSPAERLAGALAVRGRVGALDEVLREHARASGDRGRAVHLRRLREALAADDLPRALGAAFDARLDGEIDTLGSSPARGLSFDGLAERVGLHEIHAARLTLAASGQTAGEMLETHTALARLYGGALASPERAIDAWIEVLVLDPSDAAARAALLNELGSTGDAAPMVSALLRIVERGGSDRATALVDLAELARTSLDAPGLAVFAATEALKSNADSQLQELLERFGPAAREEDARIAALTAELASDGDREGKLVELAALLRMRPDRVDEYITALKELVALPGDRRSYQRTLERVLLRGGREDDLLSVLEAALRREPGADHERLALALAKERRARGDEIGALTVLTPLLGAVGSHAAAAAMALVLASRRGEDRIWAQALVRVSAPLSSSLRAVLLAVAAEAFFASGDLQAAHESAEQASRVDPSQARPVGVLATIAMSRPPDRSVAEALERAMGFIVPRVQLCEALAVAHETLGDPLLSLVWTQRWLALRPGDPRAIRTLLGRVTESGDAQRISDTLSWLLSQPQPLSDLAPALSAALLRLAELDVSRGTAMARRALEVLGPRSEELRQTVLAVADAANEPGLALALLERTLAVGGENAERVERLFEVASRRRVVGDADGVARALSRAMLDGASADQVLTALGDAPPARSSDGELSLLTARAEALARASGADAESRGRAYRELGAARWDLAGDAEGAVAAWQRAAELDPVHGIARLARDLVSFAGYSEALKHLQRFARGQSHPRDAARLLGVAANVALAAGETQAALGIAVEALNLDARHADVLAVAERAAGPEDLDTLEALYVKLSGAALGSYGERAVHYRAARQFERRGDAGRALDHAVRAFRAVPAEGVTFVLMGRLAERTGRGAEVVRALTQVAETTAEAAQRAGWLKRAAAFGGKDEESLRLRVDVLLRALSVHPEPALLLALGSAIAELAQLSPDYREIGAMRVEHSLEVLLPRLEGPEGARTAVSAARVALDLGLTRPALAALSRAVEADPDVGWFADLSDRATQLAAEVEPAQAFVARVRDAAADKYSNVGRHLLELAAQVARALEDGASAGQLMVAAAERDPDDLELARRAALAAQLTGDASLLGRIASAVPTSERVGGLMLAAAQAEASGDPMLAIEAFERIEHDAAAKLEDRRRARLRLRELYGQVGNHDKLERLLEDELGMSELSGAALARVAQDLAALLATRGKLERALVVLEDTLRSLPRDPGLLEDMAALAAQARDGQRRAAALSALVELVAPRARAKVLRELAPLLEEQGDEAGATARFDELLALEPSDVDALAALERAAEKRGDFERAAALLAQRATLAQRVDDVRRIRLRRATLLEERLGRADEARNELEALLAATGDHLAVLRVLADLHERLGGALRAAPLWMRAGAVTPDKSESADLLHRACRAFLAGGDVESARRVLDGMEAWAHSTELLELRVEVEQKSGDSRELAQALEELAGDRSGDKARHVALLVAAARAHDLAGDREDALAVAERAAQLAPAMAEPQILARHLEYRVRGPTTREHARLVVAALRGINGPLTPEQAELRCFLISEALDSAVGTGAGMRELMKVSAELGTVPLIALGIAERLTEGGEHTQSLSLFDVALAGDLRGVRHRGRVAIVAADAAREAGDLVRAQGFVAIAAAEPMTHDAAVALGGQLRSEELAREIARERTSVRREAPLVRRTDTEPGLPKAEPVLAGDSELFPGPRDSEPPPPPPVPPVRRSEPPPLTRASARPSTTYHSTAPPEHVAAPRSYSEQLAKSPSVQPAPPPRSARPAAMNVEPVIMDKGSESAPLSEVSAKVDMPPSLRRMSGTFPAASPMEADLVDRLAKGSLDAGFELVRQLENRRSRSYDLVAVCRRMVGIAPGDRELLRQLYVAALADKNHVYARAVEHALALFDPSVEPALPPSLAEQPEDPARLRSLLLRELTSPVCEALSLVWEGASHVFRRDPSTYGVAGSARLPLNAPSPLGRSYAAAARVLGLTRTPLFERRTMGAVSLGVALLNPPAVIVGGEVTRETPELSYHLGAMLVATLPEHVLLFGSSEEQARSILKSMLLAFGPPEEQKGELASAAALAEVLWERIPARAQRRLREICHEPTGIDYETAMDNARRAARRGGLFVSGDLGAALRQTCRQEGLPLQALEAPATLSKLVGEQPAIADLVRLATSSEYAAARWQSPRGTRPAGGV